MDSLDLAATRRMLLYMAEHLIAAKESLTKADQAIGDGDHGIGMARGFEAVLDKLPDSEAGSIGDLFKTVGTTIMMTTGGAAGAVFGTLFRGAAKSAEQETRLDAAVFARLLGTGLAAVQARGQAAPGDKTMIDALAPAVATAELHVHSDLSDLLDRVSAAACDGMEATRGMVATTGKAKTLGERSLGHPDPGAISMYLMLKACRDFVHAV